MTENTQAKCWKAPAWDVHPWLVLALSILWVILVTISMMKHLPHARDIAERAAHFLI
jgi:hypothetical protein